MTENTPWTEFKAKDETLAVAIQNGNIVTTRSRHLTQDEIDAHNRYQFVSKVLAWITTVHIDEGINDEGVHCTRTIGGKTARFIARKNDYHLVTLKEVRTGEWEFSASDIVNAYTYHMNDLVKFLEDLFDTGAQIISLKGEIQF